MQAEKGPSIPLITGGFTAGGATTEKALSLSLSPLSRTLHEASFLQKILMAEQYKWQQTFLLSIEFPYYEGL